MVIKPDWDIFKLNFSDNPQKNFEWMCYQLFCREFNRDKGLFRFYNQPALEAEPIEVDNNCIGFQAKFYEVNLSDRKNKIQEIILDIKSKYPALTVLYFYSNQDWTFNSKMVDRKTNAQKNIENLALENGFRIEWKTKSFFESDFASIKNSDITQYFFDVGTNEYYKKIRKIQPQTIELQKNETFSSSLYIENNENPLVGKNTLSNFIITQLKNNELEDFTDIFIRGVAGIGKSTEMKIAYNELLHKCSSEQCYHDFYFLPTPYFFELKNYQEGCFKINENETPLLFFDGIDEIANSKLISFIKELKNLKSQNTAVRFIISGRDGAFTSDANDLKHINAKLTFFIDSKLQNLIYKFKGTIFEAFVGIPFYRNFLCSSESENIKTYKDFITALIENRLKSDKQKSDRSENILEGFENGINLEQIQNKLAEFSHSLFKSANRIFSIDDLKQSFSLEEIAFLRKSCLFDYKTEENISFFSNIYFEFFVAKYYAEKRHSLIQKDLFIPTGKPIVQYINIIAILLNYISNMSKLYKNISKQLNNETRAYILLTDYTLLPVEKRYLWYKEIINEFNTDKKLIYYGRFSQSCDLLKNIDSLSDSLHNLLPEEYYDDAVKMHCDAVLNFIKNPSENEIKSFENAVILLGVYNKVWKEKQQTALKDVSIPLIQFFRENKLAEKMKGLLSEDSIFNWYELYAWTIDWGESDWIYFIEQISNTKNNDFYSFKNKDDFRLKLKLFIHFHKNNYIRNLLVPLVIKILGSKKVDPLASLVPSILDDEFKTPTIYSDNDISYFSYAIKNYEIQISDLLLILNSCSCSDLHHSSSYEADKLYREIISRFKDCIRSVSDDKIPELYKFFVKYIESDSGLYISDLNDYIKLLSDKQKENLFDLFLNDLKQKEEWQKFWMLYRTIVFLLDTANKTESCLLFEKLKEIGSIYRECVADIYIAKLEKHPLYDIAVAEYPLLFPEQAEKEKTRTKCLYLFETEKKAMLEKEIDVISNKESLPNELNRIFEYLDKNENSLQKDTDRGKLIELQADYIGNRIQYEHEENYSVPPIFSSFAIKYLFNFIDESNELNRKQAIKNSEDWFSDEKYFWRYFFWLFICHYKKEETDTFLEKYTELVEKIKNSMKKEVSCFLENNKIELYDGGQNRYWVVPFVHYISRFYDNKLPDWFDNSKILNFIAYPAWQLSTGYGGMHINGEFKWEDWNSVFDWIETVSGIDGDTIIKKALSLLPVLQSDQSQTQIITAFVERAKTESAYKQQMLDAIIDKTIVEIQKDYKDTNSTSIMNSGALSSFWRETQENFVDRIYPYIDFSKYSSDDINWCRRTVLEYFCKVADEKQKNKAIALLKNRMSEKTVQIYLAKLGYEKAIIKTINEFLKGYDFNTNYTFYSPLFGKTGKSIFLLKKYIQLYEYSLEKSNDRRQYLFEYAKQGILQTAIKQNFWFTKWKLNKYIKELKCKGLYFESVQDFLNEIEQNVFLNDDFHFII